jgi:hypothetical protein
MPAHAASYNTDVLNAEPLISGGLIGPLLALSPLGSPVSLDSFAFENEDIPPEPTCRVEKASESLLGAYRITRHPREGSFPRERATM